jgi:hypothetical protein
MSLPRSALASPTVIAIRDIRANRRLRHVQGSRPSQGAFRIRRRLVTERASPFCEASYPAVFLTIILDETHL